MASLRFALRYLPVLVRLAPVLSVLSAGCYDLSRFHDQAAPAEPGEDGDPDDPVSEDDTNGSTGDGDGDEIGEDGPGANDHEGLGDGEDNGLGDGEDNGPGDGEDDGPGDGGGHPGDEDLALGDPLAPCDSDADIDDFYTCWGFDHGQRTWHANTVGANAPRAFVEDGPYKLSATFIRNRPELFNYQAYAYDTGSAGRTLDAWMKLNQGSMSLLLEDLYFSMQDSGEWRFSDTQPVTGSLGPGWHHYALTIASGRGTLYIDGKVAAELDAMPLSDGASAMWPANGGAFAGSIDTVRVWDRALPKEEVCLQAGRVFEDGACKPCTTCNLPPECPDDPALLGCVPFTLGTEDTKGRLEIRPDDWHVDEERHALSCFLSDLRLTEPIPARHTLQVWLTQHSAAELGVVVDLPTHYRISATLTGFSVDVYSSDGLTPVAQIPSQREDPPKLLTVVRDGRALKVSVFEAGKPAVLDLSISVMAPPTPAPDREYGSICTSFGKQRYSGYLHAFRLFDAVRTPAQICTDAGGVSTGGNCLL